MKKASDDWQQMQQKILGLGEGSVRKTHYPNLRQRLAELERFRSLVDISRDLFFVVDFDSTQILDASATAVTRLGLTRETLATHKFSDLVSPQAWPAIMHHLHNLREVNPQAQLIVTELERDGVGRIPVEIAAQCLRLGGSNVALLAARDISERQRAEQRILKLNRLYEVIMRVSQAMGKAHTRPQLFRAICRLSVDCGQFAVAWVSQFEGDGSRLCCFARRDRRLPAPEKFLHLFPREAEVRGVAHALRNLDTNPWPAPWQTLAGQARSACTVPLKLHNEAIGLLTLCADEPAFFDAEEVALLEGVASDLSFALDGLDREQQRRQAERRQAESLATIEAIFKTSPMAIAVFDRKCHVSACNQACEALFGWTSANPLPQAGAQMCPPGEVDDSCKMRQRILHGETVSREVTRLHVDGTPIELLLSAAPLRNSENQVVGIIAIYVDLRERKRLEAQLGQAQKLESLGRVTGGVAHDFNNLLTVINGNCELLLQQIAADDSRRRWVEEIHDAGRRAADITHQLLAFGRMQLMQPKQVGLNLLVSGMEGFLHRLAGEEVQLAMHLAEDGGQVEADPTQLQQVLMNLVVNARDAMAGEAQRIITIETGIQDVAAAEARAMGCLPGEYSILSVSDTGCGMDEETQRRMFEPFFTTKPIGQGTGLGLSTAWGIVHQSGGFIRVASQRHRGSTFTVLLPRIAAQAKIPVVATGALPPRGSATLLLVEDRADVRQVTEAILSSLGYRVLAAATPDEAMRLSRQADDLPLMVTDVVMPEMNGRELGEKIRRIKPGIKILYTSGQLSESVLQLSQLDRNSLFLAKPFSVAELAEAVHRLLVGKTRTTIPGELTGTDS